MANFEETLRSASLAVLKRELADNERIEFMELAGAIGMNNVEDYLYMLMIFKRNEDKITGQLAYFEKEMQSRFDEMGVLEKKIDATLGNTLKDMLGQGAEKIGHAMGRDITNSAKEVLSGHGEFHFMRGWVLSLCITAVIACVSYALGSAGVFDFTSGWRLFDALMGFPAGGLAAICCPAYVITWGCDHWGKMWRPSYKTKFVLQILILLSLLLWILPRQ
jgi:hypothetical protein